jgi:hypothetical protein
MSACLCQSRTVPDGCHARRSRPRRASQPHPRRAPISAAGRAPCHALVVRALPCPGQRRGRRVGGPRAATGASGGDRRTVAPRQWLWQASRARSPEATTSPLRATVGGLAPLMRASAEGHGESPAHDRWGRLCLPRTSAGGHCVPPARVRIELSTQDDHASTNTRRSSCRQPV